MSHSSNLPLKPGVVVTDIVMRGGGGTITFSDNVTFEWVWQFRPNLNIPAGGTMAITLAGERAALVYQTIVDQTVCDFFDWLIQCTSLASRVSLLELELGRAVEVVFTVADWLAGSSVNEIVVIPSGTPGAGEVGPHTQPIGRAYGMSVFKDDLPLTIGVDIELKISLATGEITLIKAPLADPFDGRIIIT